MSLPLSTLLICPQSIWPLWPCPSQVPSVGISMVGPCLSLLSVLSAPAPVSSSRLLQKDQTAVPSFLLCLEGQNKQNDSPPPPQPLPVKFFTSSWTDFPRFPGALEHQSENCISQRSWNKTKFAAGSQLTPSPTAWGGFPQISFYPYLQSLKKLSFTLVSFFCPEMECSCHSNLHGFSYTSNT